MPGHNSCGEPGMWDYDNANEYEVDAQQIDHAQQEIQELKSQVMNMQLRIQSDELEAIMEQVVRDANPTLKDAWDKYQSLLILTGKK